MTKSKIVKELAKRVYGNVSHGNILACRTFCDCLQDIFIDAWLNGDKVIWEKFITLTPVVRAAHRGRNPKTNEVVIYPSTKSVKLQIHPIVKEILNDEDDGLYD